MRVRATYLLLAVIWLFPLVLPSTAPKQAPSNTFIVDITNDELDAACTPGDCSLREAIQAANQSPGLDRITFAQPGTYKLSLAGSGENANLKGDLDILGDLILSGENLPGQVIIDGNQIDRVFTITTTAQVTMTSLTIQHGAPPLSDPVGGGGILVMGSLTLSDTLVTLNTSSQGGGVTNSLGHLVVRNSAITRNTTSKVGGGSGEGGGIYSDGVVEVSASQILTNTAQRGGGASGSEYASMLFSDTLFAANTAGGDGGGIFNDKSIHLIDVTFTDNQAVRGGGFFSYGNSTLEKVTLNNNHASEGGGFFASSSITVLENVTVSANQATDQGGGIYNDSYLSLMSVTLAGNTAPEGSNLYLSQVGETSLRDTIIVDGSADNCGGETIVITSLGYNLESADTCHLVAASDLKNVVDPGLAPLAPNMGKTQTHALLPDSPAIDAGSPASECLAQDQRGLLRPVDSDLDGTATCDIGAFEYYINGIAAFDPKIYVTNEPASGILLISITVTRSDGTQTAEVDYLSPTPSVDVDPVQGTLRWLGGDNSPKTFFVKVRDDPFQEPDETIILQLVNPKFGLGVLYQDSIAQLIILANDAGGSTQPPPLYLPLIRK